MCDDNIILNINSYFKC